MKKIFLLLSFIFCSFCNGQEVEQKVQNVPAPTEVKDLETKDLVWNKWETKNFIILSIDKSQGLYLKNNIERIKTEVITKWGLNDFDFASDCKLVCVTNKDLLKKLFKLDNSRSEIRKDSSGKITLSVIWFYLDEDINSKITDICLGEIEQNSKNKIPLFCKKGISRLNQNIDNIKKDLCDKSLLKINSKDVISKKIEDLSKIENLDLYEKQCALLCLLFRKEYGQENFLRYLNNNDLEKSFGIIKFEDLDKILAKYSENLINDLENNKVPKEYIIINRR